MEVHHHPNVEKKNFKTYFLEFLMIFLAVTLGFFAENLREHIVDKEKERQYIRSLFEDLSNDESKLPVLIEAIERQQIRPADSLQLLFSKADIKKQANAIYVNARAITRQQGINSFITDRTVTQLRNSGEIRLIRNKQVADSIVDYYKAIEYVVYLQEILLHQKQALRETFSPVLNGYEYDKVIDSADRIIIPSGNLYLLSADATAISNCLLYISDVKGLSITIKNRIVAIISKAASIKRLISREYNE
jgi:hypothetical protein